MLEPTEPTEISDERKSRILSCSDLHEPIQSVQSYSGNRAADAPESLEPT
jgi:hypothetical protein